VAEDESSFIFHQSKSIVENKAVCFSANEIISMSDMELGTLKPQLGTTI